MDLDEKINIAEMKFKGLKINYNKNIPNTEADPIKVSKYFKTNVLILCKEITDHINKEIERLDDELNKRFDMDKEE